MISSPSLSAAQHLDTGWLDSLLKKLSQFGALENGGVDRQALSDTELDAREWLVDEARALGCEIYTDDAANLFFRRPGRQDLPPVTTGSHIDTQPGGGNFDGCYGVLAGLACLKALNDAGITTERPVEVAIWTNEEGSRFAPGAMGSSAFTEPDSLAAFLAVAGEDGVSFAEALALHHQRFSTLARRPNRDMACFVELHIEQGPLLEHLELPLAVVSGIQGVRWYQVQCQGESAHAGTTPMALRQDAMQLARSVASTIEASTLNPDDDALRLTFGRWQVTPNAVNTIPSQASFTLDFRHPDPAVLAQFDARMAQLASAQVSVAALLSCEPVVFAAQINQVLNATAQALDIPCTGLLSGAFHDAMHLAGHCPTSMLFVPSHRGISHNPAEYTEPRALHTGARALAGSLTELSNTI